MKGSTPNWICLILMMGFVIRQIACVPANTCAIEENSQIFMTFCPINSLFPTLEQATIDNFQTLFRLKDGELQLLQALDRERLIRSESCKPPKTISQYHSTNYECFLQLELSGKGPTFHQLTVLVTDLNDNEPKFDRISFQVTIPENSRKDTEVELPQATDFDRGKNGTIIYELKKSKVSSKFQLINAGPPHISINSNLQSGLAPARPPLKLRLLTSFDREVHPHQMNLILIARDLGQPSLSSTLSITIQITDLNDNPPSFNQSIYRFTVPESLPLGQPIGKLTATDRDTTSHVSVGLSPSAPGQIVDTFSLSSDGVLSSKMPLRYTPPMREYRIPVIATDGGSPALSASTTVLVQVLDVNNNVPLIQVIPHGSIHHLTVPENCPPNTYVAKLTVTDADHDPTTNAQIECHLDSSSQFELQSAQIFPARRIYSLNTASYALPHLQSSSTSDKILSNKAGSALSNMIFDRETNEHVQVRVICRDFGIPPLTSTRSLLIVIEDRNDNAPQFERSYISFSVKENEHIGTELGRLMAKDMDRGENAQTRYKLQGSSDQYLQLDNVSGQLSTRVVFDCETRNNWLFSATAYDLLDPTLHSNVTIQLTIVDVNDNKPQFKQSEIKFTTSENREGLVDRVVAIDADSGQNAAISYFLITHSNTFKVSNGGDIIVYNSAELDREKTPRFFLEIGARDHGRPSLTGSTTVEIVLKDVNDNNPIFDHPRSGQILNVSMDTPIGSRIFDIRARDADEGDNGRIEYAINPRGLFEVNQTDGGLYLTKNLRKITNFDNLAPRSLSIYAKDFGNPVGRSMSRLRIHYDYMTPGGGKKNNQWKHGTDYGRGSVADSGDGMGGYNGNRGQNGWSYNSGGMNSVNPGSNSNAESASTNRDLVLSVGIGLVLLVFAFLLLLVAYFCASVLAQKRRRRGRLALQIITTKDENDHGITESINNGQNNMEHNPNIDRPDNYPLWMNLLDKISCLAPADDNNHRNRRLNKNNIDQSQLTNSIASQMSPCGNNSNIAIGWSSERDQGVPTICFNQWDRGHQMASREDDPLYSYREFTMNSPTNTVIQSPTTPHYSNASQYWQYNTMHHHNQNSLLRGRPDLVGHQNIQDDPQNSTNQNPSSLLLLHHSLYNLGTNTPASENNSNCKTLAKSLHECHLPHLAASSVSSFSSPPPPTSTNNNSNSNNNNNQHYSGYVVGTSRIANSFV